MSHDFEFFHVVFGWDDGMEEFLLFIDPRIDGVGFIEELVKGESVEEPLLTNFVKLLQLFVSFVDRS